MYDAERGLFELRRRRALYVRDDDPRQGGGVLVAAVEGLEDRTLRRLRALGAGPLDLVVTSHRARSLGLEGAPSAAPQGGYRREPSADLTCAGANSVFPASGAEGGGNGMEEASGGENGRQQGRGATRRAVTGPGRHESLSPAGRGGAAWASSGRPAAIRLEPGATPGDVLTLCSAPGRVPVAGRTRPADAAETSALGLARLAHLLPAVVSVRVGGSRAALDQALASGEILSVGASAVGEALASPRLAVSHVSDAPVPLHDAEDAHFILFREESSLLEHVAVLIGRRERWPDPVPVRLHSACLTGDLFGSLKCDCGDQLRGSLRHFRARGGGLLLYLGQEGRGIGLGNKLRAYALQDGGLDTIDADCSLGFGADERCYDAALEMLRYLDVARVQLLTNNPQKVRAVEGAGIEVLERRALHGTLNRHNLPYVRAKVHRAGHWLGDMLSGMPEHGR